MYIDDSETENMHRKQYEEHRYNKYIKHAINILNMR